MTRKQREARHRLLAATLGGYIKDKAHAKAVAAAVDHIDGNPLGFNVAFRLYENTQHLDYLDDYGNRFITVTVIAHLGLAEVTAWKTCDGIQVHRINCWKPMPTDLPHEGATPLAAAKVKELMDQAAKEAAWVMEDIMEVSQ